MKILIQGFCTFFKIFIVNRSNKNKIIETLNKMSIIVCFRFKLLFTRLEKLKLKNKNTNKRFRLIKVIFRVPKFDIGRLHSHLSNVFAYHVVDNLCFCIGH